MKKSKFTDAQIAFVGLRKLTEIMVESLREFYLRLS